MYEFTVRFQKKKETFSRTDSRLIQCKIEIVKGNKGISIAFELESSENIRLKTERI